ncbi:MAG: hypothetical protein IJZ39_11395 [Oscillospiraceae bacterium]|nr:hypothetical protein [Oscillospiraceae bacterium]
MLAYDTLDGEMQKEYLSLRKMLLLRQQKLPVTMGLEAINRILKAVLTDDPRIFWFSGKWILRDHDGHRYVQPQYLMSESDIEEAKQIIEQYVRCFLSLPDRSAYDKARLVFDWLLKNVEYAMGMTMGQTIYDVFVERKAVCKGIAKAYQLLLKGMGVRTTLVEGSLDGVAKHVWNLVYVDGSWLHVDVCMGYECFSALFKENQKNDPYRCFLVTDTEIMWTHRIWK